MASAIYDSVSLGVIIFHSRTVTESFFETFVARNDYFYDAPNRTLTQNEQEKTLIDFALRTSPEYIGSVLKWLRFFLLGFAALILLSVRRLLNVFSSTLSEDAGK